MSAYKEGECVRQRLRHQEKEMSAMRSKTSDMEDEMNIKYSEYKSLLYCIHTFIKHK